MTPAIPKHKSSPLLGIVPAFQRNPLGLMVGLHREFGEIVQVNGPAGTRMISIAAPEMVQDVLVNQAEKIEKPAALKKVFQSSFGNGLFFSEGDFWKRQRKLVQPAFHHVKINAHAQRMVKHTQQMLDGWQESASIPLQQSMNGLTLSIVVDSIFQTSVEGETHLIYEAMHKLGQAIAGQSTNPLLAALPDAFPHPVIRRKMQASRALDAIIYRFIDERRRAGADAGDVLSSLIFAEDAETGERMSDLQVHDEAMTLFIAGHETSSNLISAVFVMLAQHPDIENKLHAEVDAVLGGRPPTLDDLAHLPYVKLVIKEALRLFPPAWILLRDTLEPITAGEYVIPHKSAMLICPYVVHRNPAYYAEPERFNPERWTAEFEASLPRHAYIPFGAGPRVCIGNGFAMLELQLILATIASQVRLIMPAGVTPEFIGGPTLALKEDILMGVEQRQGEKHLAPMITG